MAVSSCFLLLPYSFAPTLDQRIQSPSLRHSHALFQFGFSSTLRPSQSFSLSLFSHLFYYRYFALPFVSFIYMLLSRYFFFLCMVF